MRKFRPAASPDASRERVSASRPRLRKLARKPAPSRASKPKGDRRPVLAFPSLKAGCMVTFGRYWLVDLLTLLEVDPDVVSYTRETSSVTFSLDGGERTFRSDLDVLLRNRRMALAALTTAEAALEENVIAAAALKGLYAAKGVEFRVVTDGELKAQPRLDNAKLLLRYQRVEVPPEAVVRIAVAVAEGHASSLGDLHAALGGDGGAWGIVLALTARGCVRVRMDSPLGPDTPALAVSGDGRLA